jgi:hypothetical protein
VAKQTSSKRYLFQAEATGVVAQFVHPFQDAIPIQAASSLPVDGGFGSSRVDGFRHGYLSFDSAYTQVRGVKTEAGYELVAQSVIEGFKLLGVIECGRIVGQLIGRYSTDPKAPEEVSIVPTGSVFEDLRIGDDRWRRLEVSPYFSDPEISRWTGLLNAVEDEEEQKVLQSFTLPAPNGDRVRLPGPGQKRELLGFSLPLIDPAAGTELGAPLHFDLPGFGTVHLGEFFCQPHSRRLIMLRAELDGAVQGSVVVGDPSGGIPSYP